MKKTIGRTLVFVSFLLGLVLAVTTVSTSIRFTDSDVFAKRHHSSPSSIYAVTDTTSSGSASGQIAIPVETNQFSHGLDFNDVNLYLNSSDGHYHLKGTATNTLPVTRYNQIFATINFQDKGSDTTVKSITANIQGPIDPSKSVPFDFDTGYTAAQADQLQHLKVQITYI